MTSRYLLAVLAAVSAAVALVAGCVDEDPIISGNRPADGGSTPTDGATGDVVVQEIILPLDGGNDFPDGDTDDPRCRHCNDTLDPTKIRGTLCRYNNVGGTGKSSVQLLNDVVQCVCYEKCASVCGTYCSGGARTNPCNACISPNCGDFTSACLADFVAP